MMLRPLMVIAGSVCVVAMTRVYSTDRRTQGRITKNSLLILLVYPGGVTYTRHMSNHSLRTDLAALSSMGFPVAPVATFFIGTDGTSDVFLWKVLDGDTDNCKPVLGPQRTTDPDVWAAAEVLAGPLPEGVEY